MSVAILIIFLDYISSWAELGLWWSVLNLDWGVLILVGVREVDLSLGCSDRRPKMSSTRSSAWSLSEASSLSSVFYESQSSQLQRTGSKSGTYGMFSLQSNQFFETVDDVTLKLNNILAPVLLRYKISLLLQVGLTWYQRPIDRVAVDPSGPCLW